MPVCWTDCSDMALDVEISIKKTTKFVNICLSGMHDKQLYVQPSEKMQEHLSESSEKFQRDHHPGTCQKGNDDLPRVAWKPYLNTGNLCSYMKCCFF